MANQPRGVGRRNECSGRAVCRRWLAPLLLACSGLTGCQSIQLNAANAAQLRMIDAAPDAGAVDAYQNSSAMAYNLGFGTVTSYVPMVPGAYTLSASKAGTRQLLTTGGAVLAPGHQYTLVVGDVAAAMQQTVYQDQTQPAPAGQIAVRLLNQVTRGGAVDVYLVPERGKLAYSVPLATNLGFGSNTGYLAVPAGTYALAVVPAGTIPVSSTATLLSGAQTAYPSGAVRTVVLIDVPMKDAAGVQAIVAADADAQ